MVSAHIISTRHKIAHDTARKRAASAVGSNRDHHSRQFTYAGRQWRLFKRNASPDAPWYFKFNFEGETFGPKSLGTASWSLAVTDAKLAIDALRSRRREAIEVAMGRRKIVPVTPPCSSLADAFAAVPSLTIKASRTTRNEYIANAHRCLPHALGIEPAQFRSVDVPLSALNDQAGARFFEWMEFEAAKLPSQAQQNRFRRSWLSMFESALALFAPRAVYQMKQRGLLLPDLTDWRNAVKNHGPDVPRDSGANVPDDAVIRRTLREWARLGHTPGYTIPGLLRHGPRLSETDRRNVFLAIGLQLSCGLRKSESPKVLWRWRKTFSGVPHLSELDVDVKNSTGQIHVVPVDPFWNHTLRVAARNGWIGAPDDPWLTARAKTDGGHPRLQYSHGGPCDAAYWPFYIIGKWLRWLGWETQKTNHALRDFTASMLTMRYSLADASQWCRHSDLKTTARSYNRFVTMSGKINKQRIAWLRWAK